jgi:subtilisin-like proprotein convertase family protein
MGFMRRFGFLPVTVLLLLTLCDGAAARTIVSQTYTSSPGLTIPDRPSGLDDPIPVTTTIDVPLGSLVTGVEVYLDITITWSSDLFVNLISPNGTELRVSYIGEGGEPQENILGWYPGDFTPKDDITDGFDGDFTEGTWTLWLQDNSQGAEGTLNEWRLKIFYDDQVAAESTTWGGMKRLFK